MPRRLAALVLAAALATGLAACAAPTAAPSGAAVTDAPGDAGQSTADACALVQGSIEQAGSALSSASAEDPSAVVDALRRASDELASVSGRITNDQVAALLPALRDLFAQAAQAMDAVASGDPTRLGEIGDAAGRLQENTVRFAQVCRG